MFLCIVTVFIMYKSILYGNSMVFLLILAISLSLVDSKDWTTTDQNLVQSPVNVNVSEQPMSFVKYAHG